MSYKVAISGSYGGMNLGDEAILESILKALRVSADVDIVVFSRNSQDTQARHKVRAVPIREMHKDEVREELKKLDLFILGGGGILFDSLVPQFLRDVTWAKELGVPVFVYAVSVGPLKSAEARQLVAEVLNKVDKITVRESEAKRELHDLGVNQEIEVTADPALLLKAEPFERDWLIKEGVAADQPLVGFSVREPGPAAPDLNVDHYHAVLANAADFMIDRFNAQILFVPMESGENRDPQHSHAVIAKMANTQRASVLKGQYTSAQLLGLVANMEFIVGMRLHFLIFSAIQKVPFVPLPYAAKVKGFLADLGMPMAPITELNIGKLCAFLDYAWDTRKNTVKKLEEKVPLLQAQAKRTNQILCDFLASLRPRAGVS